MVVIEWESTSLDDIDLWVKAIQMERLYLLLEKKQVS